MPPRSSPPADAAPAPAEVTTPPRPEELPADAVLLRFTPNPADPQGCIMSQAEHPLFDDEGEPVLDDDGSQQMRPARPAVPTADHWRAADDVDWVLAMRPDLYRREGAAPTASAAEPTATAPTTTTAPAPAEAAPPTTTSTAEG